MVGSRVGQERPQPLGPDQFPARRRDVSPVLGDAGLHRTHQGGGVRVLDPGPAQHGARLAGQGLGPAPVAHASSPPATARTAHARGHRARPLLRRCRSRPPGRRRRHPGHRRGPARDLAGAQAPGRRDVLRREPARGFVGIGAHLLHPAPTQHGPQQGGPRLGGPVIGPWPPRRIASDRPRRPSAPPRPAAPSPRRPARPTRRSSDAPRFRPAHPATGTTAGGW